MEKNNSWHGPASYQIKVKGHLGSHWSDWFEDMTVDATGSVTVIIGKGLDQSALHGLLVRIQDLNLPLISVERIESD